jgi:Mg-chelatase subunit ChlD
MCANFTSHLHSFLLRRAFPLAAFAVISCGWAASQDDPMALPPRTSQPPASAQQESNPPQPADQQSGQPSISPIQSSEDQGRFVFRKQVQEVVLHATVVDESGRLATSLDRTAFSIFQNGQPETITSFRKEDIPVAIGIVIDNSGSMRDKRAKVNQAVLNLVRASNPEDQVFVVNFSQTPYLDQDFTSDVNLLQTALHQVSSRGSTALYDAVVASDFHLRNNPRLDKKVLLVITDGQDNMSRDTLQDALRKLQSNKGATLYGIFPTESGRGGFDYSINRTRYSEPVHTGIQSRKQYWERIPEDPGGSEGPSPQPPHSPYPIRVLSRRGREVRSRTDQAAVGPVGDFGGGGNSIWIRLFLIA